MGTVPQGASPPKDAEGTGIVLRCVSLRKLVCNVNHVGRGGRVHFRICRNWEGKEGLQRAAR